MFGVSEIYNQAESYVFPAAYQSEPKICACQTKNISFISILPAQWLAGRGSEHCIAIMNADESKHDVNKSIRKRCGAGIGSMLGL